MAMDYLKKGDQEILKDGTLVEHGEKGIVVHNVPTGKGIFKDAVLESWVNGLIKDKDYTVKDVDGKDTLAKDAILCKIVATCSKEWNIDTEKIVEVLNIIYKTPKYSSVLSEPTLNHSSVNCKECAKYHSGEDRLDEFSIEDLLYAIETLHGCGKYEGHPHIDLHGDGSGHITGKFQDDLGSFQTLRQFIENANKVMEEMEESKDQLKFDL